MTSTQADTILSNVYHTLSLQSSSDLEKYGRINDIVQQLQHINATRTINVKTTGTISERLCELGLKSAVQDIYNNLGRDWKWIGDFSILGNPFNLIVSVKSFKAKERLIASGSGHILSPTIGWGLFDDINEWSIDRLNSYAFRAFIAIYMPDDLYTNLSAEVRDKKNINGNQFVRPLDTFVNDLRNSIVNNKLDLTKI